MAESKVKSQTSRVKKTHEALKVEEFESKLVPLNILVGSFLRKN